MPTPRTINHRLVPGLRFDVHWRYAIRPPSGCTRWTALPMGHDVPALPDPCGAWWCTRRCAAVLLKRPWLSVELPQPLPPQPEAGELAQVLQGLLPGWKAQAQNFAPLTPLHCAQAVKQGGSALLLLLETAGSGQQQARVFWAWVVGVELQPVRLYSAAALAPGGEQPPVQALPRALLVLPGLLGPPLAWTMPWSVGYATRVQLSADGQCALDSVDGPGCECEWLACVVLERAAMD